MRTNAYAICGVEVWYNRLPISNRFDAKPLEKFMGNLLDFNDLVHLVQGTGQVASGFLVPQLGKELGNYACGLYHKYPQYVVQSGSVVGAMTENVLDNLCGVPSPSGQAPSLPTFTGGQCFVEYALYSQIVYSDGTPTHVNPPAYGYGPLSLEAYGDSSQENGTSGIALVSYPPGGPSAGPPTKPPIYQKYGHSSSFQVTNVVRIDGQPDNCGNPPPPPIPKPAPSEINKSVPITVNITNNDGTTTNKTYNVNFGGITNNKYDNSKTTFPVTINNAPVNINLGSDGLDSPSGATGPDPETAKQLSDLADLVKALAAALAECCKGVQPTVPLVIPDGQSKTQTDKKKLAFVKVVIDELSVDAKILYGNDSPNVCHIGWFEFSQGDFFYPRQYISFSNSIFTAPPGADGYAYHLYNGFKGHAIELTVDPATT